MSKILNSEDFGLKLYNRFPPKYREDDVFQNYALKRYLESLADGGFKYTIEEINGILDSVNPDTTKSNVLPLLFKQYGLEVFNGIPEDYLRYLLPKLGEAWSKKGSLSVVEFITASLSGIKTETIVTYDENGNPKVDVRLEMDYNIGDYFPDSEQFYRILENFIPFYCDVVLIYAYMFYESQVIIGKDEPVFDKIVDNKYEIGDFVNSFSPSTFGNAVLGSAVLGKSGEDIFQVDPHKDHVTQKTEEYSGILHPVNTFTNNLNNTLNNNFFTNGLYSYDIITVGGETEIVFN